MKTGWRVRLLHHDLEGTVREILAGGMIRVELDDGLIDDVSVRELVAVRQGEADAALQTLQQQTHSKDLPESRQAAGLYLAIQSVGNRLRLRLVNLEAVPLWVTAYFLRPKYWERRFVGVLEAFTAVDIHEVDADVLPLPSLNVAWQLAPEQIELPSSVNQVNLLLKDRHLRGETKVHPPLREPHIWIRLQAQRQSESNESEEKTEKPSSKPKTTNLELPADPSIVDLHIEKLVAEPDMLSSDEFLPIQREFLLRALDKAIRAGARNLTIIHGVGEGVLRMEVVRMLKEHPLVLSCHLDQSGRYGSGATVARLK
jgi:hypothetical protein